MDTIDDFIKQLQAVSEDKRKLPLRIQCENGLMVYPSIRMVFKDNIMFTKDSEVTTMVLTT